MTERLTIKFKAPVTFTTDAAGNPVARASNPAPSQVQAGHVDWTADELEEDERANDPHADLDSGSEGDTGNHPLHGGPPPPTLQLAIDEPAPAASVMYNVYINIYVIQHPNDSAPAQAPRGRGTGAKVAKKAANAKSASPTVSVVDTIGPALVDINSNFPEFLSSLADVTEYRPNCFVISTMKWKPFKPDAKSTLLPLTSNQGLQVLKNHILGLLKKDPDNPPCVFVNMERPRSQSRTLQPSAVDDTDLGSRTIPGSSSSKTLDEILGFKKNVATGEVLLGEEEILGVLNKGRLDDDLEAIGNKLDEQYPIGGCELHPTIHCVKHAPSGQHFDNVDGRRLIWCKRIRDGKGNIYEIPIGEHLWKAEHALKKAMASATLPQQVVPTTPVPAIPATPQAQYMQAAAMASMNPFASFGMASPIPMFNPYAMAMNAMATQTLQMTPQQMQHFPVQPGASPSVHRKQQRHDIRSSSPVMCGDEPISIDDFCKEFHLDDQIREGLKKIQFTVGDDLSVVTLQDIKDAGLTSLSWSRVTRAHKLFMKSLPSK